MRRPAIATTALLALCAAPRPLAAQDSTGTHPRLCFRGRPAPACDRFVLTEIGYYRRAAGSSSTFVVPGSGGDGKPDFSYTQRDIDTQLAWEFGLMANRGPRTAVGATLLLGVGDGGADVGIKGRYRRWLGTDGVSLDVGSGLFGGTLNGQRGSANGIGVTGDVALNAADYGAVVARLDLMRADDRTATALYGGVRLGSKPALAAMGLLGVGMLFLIRALAGGD